MKIKWIGIGDRTILGHVFNSDNNHTAEIPDVETAAELLTYPGRQFVAADPSDELEVVSFVQGDPRPADELKALRRRKSKVARSERSSRGGKL